MFDASSEPCTSLPKPSPKGLPIAGAPDAGVSTAKFSPIGCKPAGFAKLANVNCPTSAASASPAT